MSLICVICCTGLVTTTPTGWFTTDVGVAIVTTADVGVATTVLTSAAEIGIAWTIVLAGVICVTRVIVGVAAMEGGAVVVGVAGVTAVGVGVAAEKQLNYN